MRQLADRGYLPNPLGPPDRRLLPHQDALGASTSVGALHFEWSLVDGDLANNVGNWQWVAGTGNDTRPNRVINPIRQARRFDPDAPTCAGWSPSSPVSGGEGS